VTFLDFVSRLGVALTRAQRVLALIAFDGLEPRDLVGDDREMARALIGDVDKIPALARAVLVAVCGARSGKSYLSALRLLHLAVTVDLQVLAPGEVAAGLVVAPDVRLSRQTLRYVSGACEHPSLARMVVAESADSVTVERPDGKRVAIEALPASRGGSAVRGRSLVGAVLDESAFFLDAELGHVVNDVEVYRAVMPRIVRGGQTLVVSTPWTRSGLLWELFQANARGHATAIAVTAPTLLMRDFDPAVVAVVQREHARDPANAAREYEASFVDSSASLLSSADVEACVEAGVASRPPRPDVLAASGYAVTVDVGLRNDSTVVMAGHVESRSREGAPVVRVLVVDACVILKPEPLRRVTIDQVEDAVAGVCGRYRVSAVHADIHLHDALAPRLQVRGIAYRELSMSPGAQETRAKTLAAMFSALAVRLVDEPTLASQLRELRVTRHAGGRVSVGAQGSKHDDAADALLLLAEVSGSLPACGGDAGRVEFREGRPHYTEEGIFGGGSYVEVLADGSERPAAVPTWDSGWAEHVAECVGSGEIPVNVMQWLAERGWRPGMPLPDVGGEPPLSVPVQHGAREGFGGWGGGFGSARK
jgi:hypothetical protein